MIGYYVHHQGHGHRHRALAVAQAWRRLTGEDVTGLSSLPGPEGWPGKWLELAADDRDERPRDPRARGLLHWAPLGDPGYQRRMSDLVRWATERRPRAVVVDVSVEVAVALRLQGVPVVSTVLPGRRDDAAHLWGFGLSDALVAAWPASVDSVATAEMTPSLPPDVAARVHRVGAVSRLRPQPGVPRDRRPGPPSAVVLQGGGGGLLTELDADGLTELVPGFRWTVLGGRGSWAHDPTPVLADADVVVTSAGQGSVADVAAVRRPAVVVACPRPHDEQAASAAVLDAGPWPAVSVPSPAAAFTPAVLGRAARLDGGLWADWCDGSAADRFASVVAGVALPASA